MPIRFLKKPPPLLLNPVLNPDLAAAVSTLLGESRWAGAALARAEVLLTSGGADEDAARILYDSGCFTLTKSPHPHSAAQGKRLRRPH
jgi:hypothetical protein